MTFAAKFLEAIDQCKNHGLSINKISALAIIAEAENGVYIGFLARRLKISASATTQLANQLCDRGLAKRVKVSEGKQIAKLHITSKGRDALSVILPNKTNELIK